MRTNRERNRNSGWESLANAQDEYVRVKWKGEWRDLC